MTKKEFVAQLQKISSNYGTRERCDKCVLNAWKSSEEIQIRSFVQNGYTVCAAHFLVKIKMFFDDAILEKAQTELKLYHQIFYSDEMSMKYPCKHSKNFAKFLQEYISKNYEVE